MNENGRQDFLKNQPETKEMNYQSSNWIAYQITPIDNGWENLKTVKDTIVDIVKNEELSSDSVCGELAAFINNWNTAKSFATQKGWEGDFRREPCVFWIPADTNFEYGFIIKETNNGTTYVISPQPLSWLKPV